MPGITSRSISPSTRTNMALAKAVLANDAAAIREMTFSHENPFESTLPTVVEGKFKTQTGSSMMLKPAPKRVLPTNSPAHANADFGSWRGTLLGYAVFNGLWDAVGALMAAGANPFSGSTTVRGDVEHRNFNGSVLQHWKGAEGVMRHPGAPATPDLQAIGAWVEQVLNDPALLKQALNGSTVAFKEEVFRHMLDLGTPSAQRVARQVEKSVCAEDKVEWLYRVISYGSRSHVQAVLPEFSRLTRAEFAQIHERSQSSVSPRSMLALWTAIQGRPQEEWADWLVPLPGTSEKSRKAIQRYQQAQEDPESTLVRGDYGSYDGLLTFSLGFVREGEKQWHEILDQALAVEKVGKVIKERWAVLLGAALYAQKSTKFVKKVASLMPPEESWDSLTCMLPNGERVSPFLAAMPPMRQDPSVECLRFLQKQGVPLTEDIMLALANQITYSTRARVVGKVLLEWGKEVPLTDEMFQKIRLEKDREWLRDKWSVQWRAQQLEAHLPAVEPSVSKVKPRF